MLKSKDIEFADYQLVDQFLSECNWSYQLGRLVFELNYGELTVGLYDPVKDLFIFTSLALATSYIFKKYLRTFIHSRIKYIFGIELRDNYIGA